MSIVVAVESDELKNAVPLGTYGGGPDGVDAQLAAVFQLLGGPTVPIQVASCAWTSAVLPSRAKSTAVARKPCLRPPPSMKCNDRVPVVHTEARERQAGQKTPRRNQAQFASNSDVRGRVKQSN